MHIYWHIYRKLAVLLLVLGLSTASAQDASRVSGLITVASDNDVAQTRAQLERALDEAGLTVVATVDHAANAESAGLELRPTYLYIFGNPEAGTPLMQQVQGVGIDLPQKMLVWQNEARQVFVSYNDPAYLAERHELAPDSITGIAEVLDNLAAAAVEGPTEK